MTGHWSGFYVNKLLWWHVNEKGYLSTLPKSTLIILFSKMLKRSKMISSRSKNIVKENSGYLRIFHSLK
jgi:hypothetical protein